MICKYKCTPMKHDMHATATENGQCGWVIKTFPFTAFKDYSPTGIPCFKCYAHI